jgi:hypothetical protein
MGSRAGRAEEEEGGVETEEVARSRRKNGGWRMEGEGKAKENGFRTRNPWD